MGIVLRCLLFVTQLSSCQTFAFVEVGSGGETWSGLLWAKTGSLARVIAIFNVYSVVYLCHFERLARLPSPGVTSA